MTDHRTLTNGDPALGRMVDRAVVRVASWPDERQRAITNEEEPKTMGHYAHAGCGTAQGEPYIGITLRNALGKQLALSLTVEEGEELAAELAEALEEAKR